MWSISSRAADPDGRRDPLAGVLLLASAPLLAAGLLAPAVSLTSFVVFGATYSILDGVLAFWSDGRHGLFALVFAVSVVLPVVKIAAGAWAWWRPGDPGGTRTRMLGFVAAVSRWSMLDVAIVAILVLALEGSLITTADIHLGLVLFAAAAAVSSAALHRLVRRR